MTLQERKELLHELMGEFQHIEELLKWGIDSAYTIARVRTADVMPFKLSEDDVVTLPLRPLIERFSKFVEDDDLIKRLGALNNDRNRCAHRAFADFRWDAGLFSATDPENPDVVAINAREIRWLKEVRDAVDGVRKDLWPQVRRLAEIRRGLTEKKPAG